jgi:hypothetical protein
LDVITIKYKPWWFPFLRKSIKKFMPASWNEADSSDLISISRYILSVIDDKQLMSEFLKVPNRIIKCLTDFELWNIAQFIKLIDRRDAINIFIIKEIKHKNIVLKAPRDLFKDVSFGDFVLFDSHFMDYSSGDKEALDKFILHLYKKENNMISGIEDIKSIPDYLKYAIIMNYEMTRDWLALRYTNLFVKGEQEKNIEQRKSNNWLPVLDSLIADDLANSDKYEKLSMHTVLRYLNEKMKKGK